MAALLLEGEPGGDGGDDFLALGFGQFAVDGEAEDFEGGLVGDFAAGAGTGGKIGEAGLLIEC